jgi:hypothetical protein
MLKSGQLLNLFPAWSDELFPLYVYHPSRRFVPAKLRVFTECVVSLRSTACLTALSSTSSLNGLVRDSTAPAFIAWTVFGIAVAGNKDDWHV